MKYNLKPEYYTILPSKLDTPIANVVPAKSKQQVIDAIHAYCDKNFDKFNAIYLSLCEKKDRLAISIINNSTGCGLSSLVHKRKDCAYALKCIPEYYDLNRDIALKIKQSFDYEENLKQAIDRARKAGNTNKNSQKQIELIKEELYIEMLGKELIDFKYDFAISNKNDRKQKGSVQRDGTIVYKDKEIICCVRFDNNSGGSQTGDRGKEGIIQKALNNTNRLYIFFYDGYGYVDKANMFLQALFDCKNVRVVTLKQIKYIDWDEFIKQSSNTKSYGQWAINCNFFE